MFDNKFLTDRDLANRYQVSRCTIWRWAKMEILPKPVKLSPAVSRWRSSDIEAHEADKAA